MIHDLNICKDCRYNNINSYSKIRHCARCNNYGQKILKANVVIVQRPVEIIINCPHCDSSIEMKYSEFCDVIGSDCPSYWEHEIIICHDCGKEIEINETEWD